MKKLVAAFTAVFFMFVVFACTDDTGSDLINDSDTITEELPDDVMSENDVDEVDDVETQEAEVADETDVDSGDDASDADDQAPGVDVPESLPSDPTEDPEGHSAYYSFPDWEVPPSNDDNR